MKHELVSQLHYQFEQLVRTDVDSGVEFWLARDLQTGEVTKMVPLGSGAEREIEDIALTRYACYLIAQNGDPSTDEGAHWSVFDKEFVFDPLSTGPKIAMSLPA